MRIAVSLLLAVSCLAACEADVTPQTAEIVLDMAEVRSGPGSEYYVTTELPRRTRVEVYRRVKDGWLAIRPPRGSFSWVLADRVRTTARRDVARVVGGPAVSWIGASTDSIETHMWQVRLTVGESMKVLGTEQRTMFPDDEEREYLKIEPPAGEFRWIHEDAIRARPAQTSVQQASVELAVDQSQVELLRVAEPITAAADIESLESDGHSTTATGREGFSMIAERDRANDSTVEDSSAAPAPRSNQLKELELRLSREVAQPRSRWRFQRLRRDIAEALTSTSSSAELARARQLLREVESFAALQGSPTAGSDRALSDGEPASPPDDAPLRGLLQADTSASSFDPRFDGRGWLLPVHSTKQASPPYALLDAEGRIRQFVSPGPGLNLHRYLRKQVGIFGQQSRGRFLDKPHLTAHRIVDISKQRR